jgi:hypothetical protein
MAERTAVVLFDSGLVESVQTCEDLSFAAAEFSRAWELIGSATEMGAYTEPFRDHYATAEYLRENGFCSTANWSLHEGIIDPLESFLALWEGIEDLGTYFAGLFEVANSSIQEMEGRGMDREHMLMKADYSRAEKAWDEHEYDAQSSILRRSSPDLRRYPNHL